MRWSGEFHHLETNFLSSFLRWDPVVDEKERLYLEVWDVIDIPNMDNRLFALPIWTFQKLFFFIKKMAVILDSLAVWFFLMPLEGHSSNSCRIKDTMHTNVTGENVGGEGGDTMVCVEYCACAVGFRVESIAGGTGYTCKNLLLLFYPPKLQWFRRCIGFFPLYVHTHTHLFFFFSPGSSLFSFFVHGQTSLQYGALTLQCLQPSE